MSDNNSNREDLKMNRELVISSILYFIRGYLEHGFKTKGCISAIEWNEAVDSWLECHKELAIEFNISINDYYMPVGG
jgi:hypothetical protein